MSALGSLEHHPPALQVWGRACCSGCAEAAGAEEQTLPGILQSQGVSGGTLKTLLGKAGPAVPKVGGQASVCEIRLIYGTLAVKSFLVHFRKQSCQLGQTPMPRQLGIGCCKERGETRAAASPWLCGLPHRCCCCCCSQNRQCQNVTCSQDMAMETAASHGTPSPAALSAHTFHTLLLHLGP